MSDTSVREGVRRMPRWLQLMLAVVLVATFASGWATTVVVVLRTEEVLDQQSSQMDRGQDRTDDAVQRILDEVRDPQSEAGDTREETFDRIRQLCELTEGCEP